MLRTLLYFYLYDRIGLKRFFWRVMATLSTLLLFAVIALLVLSCNRTKPSANQPAAVPVDTTRQRLQRQVDADQARVQTANHRTRQTQTPHEDATAHYDSLRSRLPH